MNMSYNNKEEFPQYMQTAGKISVLAAVVGFAVFLLAFIVDIGQQEIQKVSAQTATTSLTVLNTPPTFTVFPYEVTPSSTSTPSNSGTEVTWSAIGTDANGADYYLLVCSTNASPTAQASDAPFCPSGTQWGVSTATISGTTATISTTTVEVADNASTEFAESNVWFAWVCDADPTQAACNPIAQQGDYATSSSPFNMNQRPVLTLASPAGEVDPGGTLTFNSSSTDPDTVIAADDLFLVVCANAVDYNATTNNCDDNFIASSTATGVTLNASAATSTAAVVRDGTYDAFVFLIDEHGHEASVSIEADFTVSNVAPTVLSGDIILNGGANLNLVNASAGETTGLTLDFTVNDANSCQNTSGLPGSEIPGYEVAVYRTAVGTTTCDTTGANYDPNFCYDNGVSSAAWNLTCTASTTSCTGPTDSSQLFECTFPLWFVADPTDDGPHVADTWSAAIAGGDDQSATSSLVASAATVQLISAPFFSLATAVIPYGALAPGDDTGTLATTTTIENIGNTGLDQELDGSAMCPPFVSSSTDCSLLTDSTIFTSNQKFSSTSLAYSSPLAQTLPTTTDSGVATLDLDVIETVATSTFATGDTHWGIAVPISINVSGSYTGRNTFYGVVDPEW
jgi:hypothetical protein